MKGSVGSYRLTRSCFVFEPFPWSGLGPPGFGEQSRPACCLRARAPAGARASGAALLWPRGQDQAGCRRPLWFWGCAKHTVRSCCRRRALLSPGLSGCLSEFFLLGRWRACRGSLRPVWNTGSPAPGRIRNSRTHTQFCSYPNLINLCACFIVFHYA